MGCAGSGENNREVSRGMDREEGREKEGEVARGGERWRVGESRKDSEVSQ